MQLLNLGHADLRPRIASSLRESGHHVVERRTLPCADLPRMHAGSFASSASVNSSRIASSATRALNSAEWFFLFVISDRLSR
jgi:hypothetical protein